MTPINAWLVVDCDGDSFDEFFRFKSEAVEKCDYYEKYIPAHSPYRVIPVIITEREQP